MSHFFNRTSKCTYGCSKFYASIRGQPFAIAQLNNSRCLLNFASMSVCRFHGQPFARNH
jgi:hypothetical protein